MLAANKKVADQTTWIWRLVGIFVFFCILHEQVLSWCSTNISHLMTKATQWHVHQAKTQISLGICPVWSVSAVRMKKAWVLSYPMSAQWRLWSDWADAQADLSLRWAHSHFVGFVMRRLIYAWNHVDHCDIQLVNNNREFRSWNRKSNEDMWKLCMD